MNACSITSDMFISFEEEIKINLTRSHGNYSICYGGDKYSYRYHLTFPLPGTNYPRTTMIKLKITLPISFGIDKIRLRLVKKDDTETRYLNPYDSYTMFFNVYNIKENESLMIEFYRNDKLYYIRVIDIPNLVPLSGYECSICLENVDIQQKRFYLSQCHHLFHEECINDYVKCSGRTFDKCKCRNHGVRIKSFPCPMCRTLLEDN